MTIAVLAEKPSVARDIARVVGAKQQRNGVLTGNGYAVTWAVGHLVALAEPHQVKPQWKRWRVSELPMIPSEWPLEVVAKTRDRFEVVSRLLHSSDVDEIVCATDAGREGELIFRYIYEAAGVQKPVKRLWVSSLTEEAIRDGLANLRDGSEYDGLADAARGRSRADWLVGMNLSRAYTLVGGDTLSVGRVQTPTLAMLVERELAIRNFVPEDYREVSATFEAGSPDRRYEGLWFRELTAEQKANAADATEALSLSRRLPADGEEAERIVARALAGQAEVQSVEKRQRKLPPPFLYDLTELQRHANRLYGYSAKKTLDIAQSLYETKKLLSYPRTDSRHLSASVAADLGKVVRAIREPYEAQLAPGTGERPLGDRYVDDTRVTDHHALIPTPKPVGKVSLSKDEANIYDLVCRRLLSAWHEDHLYSTTTVITVIRNDDLTDRYRSSGTTIDREGWKLLDVKLRAPAQNGAAAPAEPQLPAGLADGHSVDVAEAKSVPRKTRPPRRFTDSTLLTGMETAGRTLDDKQLSDAMRASGLGTPATRAAIIETLIQRGYVMRQKKTLNATDKGISLIGIVHEDVRSPRMTGEWEARLQAIQAGRGHLGEFMQGIESYVKDVVERVVAAPKNAPPSSPGPPSVPVVASRSTGDAAPPIGDEPAWVRMEVPPLGNPPEQLGLGIGAPTTSPARTPREAPKPRAPHATRKPTPANELDALLRDRFGFDSFRPYQRAVCEALTKGHDALLVMPTGAGKSLCYQLPGIARAGTTVVVSPLIALMEDQVTKLQAQGFVAERIHSGRKRSESRQVSLDYLDGRLDFLFIAPERLGVTGFPEMLARRKPSLIAIDEAHCISQWGHDFRPDYRMLGDRLPLLRPTPIIALTATATPIVQRDIVKQLGIPDGELHIHGFRRDNIFIELVEMRPGARNGATVELLSKPEHRPAIVYAPTRKKAEELARHLAGHVPSAVYHAGIAAAKRDRVQASFLSGETQVIVATVAFGMGIDKADVRTVVHTALPASIEGYYQEIGRAGRDGLPSRAVLYHSYADRRTHEWFLDRDYPDTSVLLEVQRALPKAGDGPIPRSSLEQNLRMASETIEKALEKLWIHGGAIVDADDLVSRGHDAWQEPYRLQREHKQAQLDDVSRFSENHDCHMLQLVRHFGDQADSGKPCGHCASCLPDDAVALDERPADTREQQAMCQILDSLRERDGQSKGRLHKVVFGKALDRKAFEVLLGGLVRAKLVHEQADSFESEGQTIHFRRLHLTQDGRSARKDDIASLSLPKQAAAPSRTRSASGKGRKRRAATAEYASNPPAALVEALKRWRTQEAKRRKCPAFRILTDRALLGIASEIPRDEESLLAVKGMGPTLVKKYGEEILAITTAS